MSTADFAHANDAAEFRSPKRALVRAFRLSRDRWKQKAGERRQQIKALQIRARDLLVSRDLWKEKALAMQRQLEQLLMLASAEQDAAPAASSPPQQPAVAPVAAASLPQEPSPPQPTPVPVAEPLAKKKRRRHC